MERERRKSVCKREWEKEITAQSSVLAVIVNMTRKYWGSEGERTRNREGKKERERKEEREIEEQIQFKKF